MIDSICREIKNYFSDENDRFIGDFFIVDGEFSPSFSIQDGQYYRIVGSVFNDGVYIRGQEELKDETFNGAIWLMKPPKDFLKLVEDIEAWQEKYGGVDSVSMSPYSSESFGGYSYSKAVSTFASGNSSGQSGLTWQSEFSDRLAPYGRVRIL